MRCGSPKFRYLDGKDENINVRKTLVETNIKGLAQLYTRFSPEKAGSLLQ
jgi:hypothetical protein